MTRLILSSIRYYWRTNVAVVFGVATAVAVLSGAILVGSSVKASLRDLVLQRLGATDVVVGSDRFFRESLADAFSWTDDSNRTTACPIIHLQGVLERDRSGRGSRTVEVYGVDDRFWQFHGIPRPALADDASALAGSPLANAMGLQPGDDLLLRLDTAGSIPRETLFGRRDNVGRTIRLKCQRILAANELGEFALRPVQGDVLAIFVPLARLQHDLDQPARANAILVGSSPSPTDTGRVRAVLDREFTLGDAGVTVRSLLSGSGVAVESVRIMVDDAMALAVRNAAADIGAPSSGVFSYLANTIRAGAREIPYSVITAADIGQGALSSVRVADGTKPPATLAPDDSIWLTEWASKDLRVRPGDPVDVDYFRWDDDGRLAAATTHFRLAGVVGIAGDVDTAMAPEFPGMSDARDIRAWDPPFPMDLRRIRSVDEDYWHRYRATPKAFVTLARGQQLWQSRYGRLTSVRAGVPTALSARFADRLRSRMHPETSGFTIAPVRTLGVAASQGATDFGEYFVYFSFFLIAAAILLAAAFFRLGIDQRVREVGTLKAIGFSASRIRRLFLAEAAFLSVLGSLLGAFGAVAYGSAIVAGLRTWWIGAVGTTHLHLHYSARELVLGAALGVFASLAAVLWTLRDRQRASVSSMLAGVLDPPSSRTKRALMFGGLGAGAFVAAVALLAAASAGIVSEVGGFFGAGALLLTSMLSLMAAFMRRTQVYQITKPGWQSLVRLGARQVTHRPGRSLTCIALIASATFVIVSVEAFRKDAGAVDLARTSGTGGFALVARSVLPVLTDPNSAAGRDALGIGVSDHPEFAHVRFVSFRERPGEDASCLNLYTPQEPRILGAPSSFVREARFSFQSSLATTVEQKRNPWLMIEAPQPDGAIPAVGDANTLQYILHREIGDEVVVRGDGGAPVRLRLVAALRDSILQGELIVSDSNFRRMFPNRDGFRFFLLETPAADSQGLAGPLEDSMADWGVKIERTSDALAAYRRVENTYLSTFQSLGALGLVLGTVGLAAVMLRNVLERRRELALLLAVGYRRGALSLVILAENALLMIGGLACGSVCALLAVVPPLLTRGESPPFAAAGIMLAAVLVVGVVSSAVAVLAVRRMPLLASIRSE